MAAFKTILSLVAFVGIVAVSALRADTAKPARAEVIFDHPEKFADVRDAYWPTDKGEQGILNQIRDTIATYANFLVPEGEKLTITFTDIHLVGDFEPWRGPYWQDIRIVKSIYPPSYKFTWKVTDAANHVVKQGAVDTVDMDYDWRINIDYSDPLRFEKEFFRDWMRTNLGDLKGNFVAR